MIACCRRSLDGVYGKIAVTYFEWADVTSTHVIVPWTIIANKPTPTRRGKTLGTSRRTARAGPRSPRRSTSAPTSSPKASSAA